MNEYKMLKKIAKFKDKEWDLHQLKMTTKSQLYEMDFLDDFAKKGFICLSQTLMSGGKAKHQYFKMTNSGFERFKELQKIETHYRYRELREWIIAVIAIAAFIKSFFF
ncbi:MAG: hypothetical protein AB9921_06065 [Erysipelotrichaceae bacterium]